MIPASPGISMDFPSMGNKISLHHCGLFPVS